jgi:MFS family permease
MTSPAAGSTRASLTEDAPEQRRTLAVLLLAQILSGAGLAAGITVGALLAEQMLGSSRLSGLPTVFFTIGSAAAAVVLGRLSQRFGRRAGLSAGYLTGAIGSVGVVVAASIGNLVLLFASLLVYGAGAATICRRATQEQIWPHPPAAGGRSASCWSPRQLGRSSAPIWLRSRARWPAVLVLPALAGPFMLAALAYVSGALALWLLLRPDPCCWRRAGPPLWCRRRVNPQGGN